MTDMAPPNSPQSHDAATYHGRRDPLPNAMLVALHERHAAPPGFDSKPEECDTCKAAAAIAVTVANSPDALITAICVVNVEGEKYLDRERWKELRGLLIDLERSAYAH